MAKEVDTSYSGKFNLPIPVGRLNPVPADSSEIWDTFVEAQAYAQTGATAYVGQKIFVKATNTTYIIINTAGDLKAILDEDVTIDGGEITSE